MAILEKQVFNEKLNNYYTEKHGEKDTDIWFEQPAINVWVFRRDNRIITLKSHILTGEVEELTEEI